MQAKIANFSQEIAALTQKQEETKHLQEQASLNEDFQLCSQLDSQINELHSSLVHKQRSVQKMRDGLQKLEKQKCEHQQHLLVQMTGAANKVDGLVAGHQREMDEFESQEQSALLKAKKQLKFERIRIQETRQEASQQEGKAQAIEDSVTQALKNECSQEYEQSDRIDDQVSELNAEIDQLLQKVRQLEQKKEALEEEKLKIASIVAVKRQKYSVELKEAELIRGCAGR